MTTERHPTTFEAAMSDLVCSIGAIKKLPVGLSAEDYQRGQDQAVRLIGALQALRYPHGLPAHDHEFQGGVIP